MSGRLYRRNDGGHWHADYVDSSGKRIRRSTKTANKQAAQKLLDQWRLTAIEQQSGVETSATLQTLISEYESYLDGKAERHQAQTITKIRRIVDAAGWRYARQITRYETETIVRQLPSLRDMGNGQPMSLRTQSHYITSIKAFTRWLATIRLALVRDPLVGLKKPSWEQDRRLVRRFLLPEEWRWLAMTPNAILYETAIQTGFRASELMALKPASLRDDHLFLAAKYTKNRRNAKQFVTPELATKLAHALPFGEVSAKMLRSDLAIARWLAANNDHHGILAAVDAEGRVIDMHSLRHTCGAWLAIQGTSPKIIQAVMRHQSITMTLDVYGHLMPGAEQDAILRLAPLLNVPKT